MYKNKTLKWILVAWFFFIVIPYFLVYSFDFFNEVALGRVFAILFIYVIIVIIFVYQIFFVPIPSKSLALDKGISVTVVKKIHQLFRLLLVVLLIAFFYLQILTIVPDVYDFLFQNEKHLIYARKSANDGRVIFDKLVTKEGVTYNYLFITETIQNTGYHFFIVLPRSKLVLKQTIKTKNWGKFSLTP